MHFKLRLAFSVGIFTLLSCTLSTCVVTWQSFQVSLAGHNHCPSPLDAFQGLKAKSHTQCAVECSFSPRCIDFSYYASSGRCYLYSSLPSKVSYNSDCNFMMDWNAYLHSNCTAMALAKGSCRGSVDDYYGCLTLTIITSTKVNFTVCPALPGVSMQLEMVSLNLGGGLIPLPTVNNWIIMLQHFDGSENFDRNWNEYRNGFGDRGRGEFWLGNEKVHLATAQPRVVYELRVEVYTNGEWFYANYAAFSLDSENNKYTLRLSGFSGNAGDSLISTTMASNGYLGGMSFTTWDKDNDRNSANCAQLYKGGWWFNNCHLACLACLYSDYFKWLSLEHLPSQGILRGARMMIKSK